jgi:hypothetical protein
MAGQGPATAFEQAIADVRRELVLRPVPVAASHAGAVGVGPEPHPTCTQEAQTYKAAS